MEGAWDVAQETHLGRVGLPRVLGAAEVEGGSMLCPGSLLLQQHYSGIPDGVVYGAQNPWAF